MYVYIYFYICAISYNNSVAVFGNFFSKEKTSLLQVYHMRLHQETSFLARENWRKNLGIIPTRMSPSK